MIKQSEVFRENAENCAQLAEAARNEPRFLRYKRMEAAWLALAAEQDWLDGELQPREDATTALSEIGRSLSTELNSQKAGVLKQNHQTQADQRDAAE
jgi:hypothetical protein